MDKVAALPDITERQYAFLVDVYANGKTLLDAYQAHYSVGNKTPPQIMSAAKELCTHSKLAVWIAHIKEFHVEDLDGARVRNLRELQRLKGKAEEMGDIKAALKAQEIIGRIEQVNVNTTIHKVDRDDRTLLQSIRDTLGEAAYASAAQKLGYVDAEFSNIDTNDDLVPALPAPKSIP